MLASQEPVLGLYRAEVALNNDPQQRGRVVLRVPQILGDALTDWAEPSAPPASIPDIHDAVWVQFSGGDVTKPVYAAYAGGTVEIPDVGGPSDTLPPKAPTALTATTGYDLTSEGNSSAWVVATWIAPTENVDSSPLSDLDHYEVRWSYDNATWTPSGAVTDTTARLDRLRTGVRVYVNVRSIDRSGNASLWGAYDLITGSASDPLPVPSLPTIASKLSGVLVAWDGLTATAAAMPSNLLRVEVHRGLTAAFTITDATLISSFTQAGSLIDTSAALDVTYYYRLVSVNRVFVRSAGTTGISGTPRRAVTDDLADNLITAQKIVNAAIDATKVGFTVGGGNILPNSSFEADANADGIPDSWLSYVAGSPVTGVRELLTTRGVTYGTKALHLKAATMVNGDRVGISLGSTASLSMVTGRPHCLSVDVDNPAGGAPLVVQLDYRTSADAFISSETITVAPGSAAGRYSKALTVPATAAKFRLYIYLNALSSLTAPEAWVDSIQLEQGNVPTAYSPVSDEILDGAVTTTKIANAAITDAKINDLSAAKITAGFLDVANRIQAGSIDALKIGANSITAGQIAAGTITGDRLAASTITTQNLDVQAMSDNMISNGDMETLDGTRVAEWQLRYWQGTIPTIGVETTTPISGTKSLKIIAADDTSSAQHVGSNNKTYSVRPGETYFLSAKAQSSRAIAGKRLQIVMWSTDDKTQVWTALRPGTLATQVALADSMTGEVQVLTGTFTVPDGQFYMTPSLSADPSGDGAGYTLLWDEVEMYRQLTNVKIANGAITADHVSAGAITADKLTSELVLAGSIKTGLTGSRVEMDDDSLRVYDNNGQPTAVFPTDADLPNQFTGNIFASGLTVNDGLSVRGAGEFSTGSTTSLKSSVTTSGVPPTVTIDYPSIPFNAQYQDYRSGCYWDGANYYMAVSLFGTGLYQITPAGVISKIGFDKNGSNNVMGLTKIGSTWYVLAEAGYGRLSGVYVYAYNSSWVKTAEWLYSSAMPKYKPCIGTNGTQLLIGQVLDAGTVTIKQYSTTGTLAATLSSTQNLSRDLSGVMFGTFDYGANRYLLSTRIAGTASAVYTYTVSGTTLTVQTNETFPCANNELMSGLGYDGTNIVTLSRDTGRIYKYTANKWTTESPLWWASFAWRQGTASTFLTTQSARAKFTMKKRAQVTLSVPPIPVTGDPTDPDSVTFYMARGTTDPGRTSSYQQTLPALGARSQTLTAATFTGTNPVASTTFTNAKPASIESTKAGVNGPLSKIDADGTVRASTLAVGDVTTPATGFVSAVGFTHTDVGLSYSGDWHAFVSSGDYFAEAQKAGNLVVANFLFATTGGVTLTTSATAIGTLPTGYRPIHDFFILAQASTNAAFVRVNIPSSGIISAQTLSGTVVLGGNGFINCNAVWFTD